MYKQDMQDMKYTLCICSLITTCNVCDINGVVISQDKERFFFFMFFLTFFQLVDQIIKSMHVLCMSVWSDYCYSFFVEVCVSYMSF